MNARARLLLRSVDAVLARARDLQRRAAVLEFRLRRFIATLRA